MNEESARPATTAARTPKNHQPKESQALVPAGPAAPIARVEIVGAAAVAPSRPDPLAGSLDADAVYTGGLGLAVERFKPSEHRKLMDPAQDDELDVLPTGEVYMGGVHVRRRLLSAFGPGGWGLRPLSLPKLHDRTVTQLWELVVRGRAAAQSWGECDYQPTNPRMSYATALEAAKTNALTRCGKDLGIGSECWDRRWANAWRDRVCVKVHRRLDETSKERERWQWRRLDARPWWDEDGVADDQPQASIDAWRAQRRQGRDQDAHERADDEPQAERRPARTLPRGGSVGDQRPISDGQKARLWAIMRECGISKEVLHVELERHYSYTVDPVKRQPSAALLRREHYDALVDWVQGGGK